ncbi:MAG TPA: hypothetical protein VK699_18465 [Terriglobales bacterium]|jgi:hypothetical protein|nr:hypothetical protein [Terriglobales bacterium]
MTRRIYTGALISGLVALIEKRICFMPDCGRLGQPCAKCGANVCKAHGENCIECGALHCEDCAAFHPVYCEKARAGDEAAGSAVDPVHDCRQDSVREVRLAASSARSQAKGIAPKGSGEASLSRQDKEAQK